MKADVKKNGMWWSWIENCDKCGKLIYSHSVQHSNEPDMKEVDFCVECLRYLLSNNIPYETAKNQYKQSF